jgi:hypothetical protein
MTLDLFTFITRNSWEYAEYLKYIAEKKISGRHKINWKCVESLGADRLPSGFKVVCKTGGVGEHNSMKHAIAMERALDYIESEYVLFIDADVAIVYNGWDDVIVDELSQYDCFGGAHAEGKSSFLKNRYKKFPKVNLFSFRTEILEKTILDFKPFVIDKSGNKQDEIRVKKKYESVLGIKVGNYLKCDTGWKLPIIFKENNLSYNFMPCYLMSNSKYKLPFLNDTNKKLCLTKGRGMEEWHYNEDLFATHKKFSRHCALSDKLGMAWKQRVDLYLERDNYEKKEKEKFAVC